MARIVMRLDDGTVETEDACDERAPFPDMGLDDDELRGAILELTAGRVEVSGFDRGHFPSLRLRLMEV